MIVIRMCGGLGNQMFQYALGRRLSLDRKTPLLLDISNFSSSELRGETPRSYRLNFFRIQAQAAENWQQAVVQSFPPHTRIEMMGINEPHEFFDPNVLQCPEHAYLIGYWQTEKYFDTITDQLRADLQLVTPLTSTRQAIADQMAACNSVSLHIRHGDFLTHPAAIVTHGTCSPEWYTEAIDRMAARIPDMRLFVFSDDPEWGRAHLPQRADTVFIDPNPDDREFEDMHLMARCRHHILANSSFSWWGAWLNPSPDKCVIAPARWTLIQAEINDRLPASWIRF